MLASVPISTDKAQGNKSILYFLLENTNGLSNLIAGFVSFDEAVTQYTDNLDIISSGPIPPNPSELLNSEVFDELIKTVKEKYDYIFIDTPPINVVSDALVLSPKTDGLILLVRNGITPHDKFEHAIESAKVANINILGAIMNGTDPDESRYFKYKYKYKYGYRYSKSKYNPYNYEYNKKA